MTLLSNINHASLQVIKNPYKPLPIVNNPTLYVPTFAEVRLANPPLRIGSLGQFFYEIPKHIQQEIREKINHFGFVFTQIMPSQEAFYDFKTLFHSWSSLFKNMLPY